MSSWIEQLEAKKVKETEFSEVKTTLRKKRSSKSSDSIHSSSIEKDNISFPEDIEIKNSEFTVQEKNDLAITVLNWIQGYRINVVRSPNGKQAILEMPRMLKLYEGLTGYEYIETKNDNFKEYLSKIKERSGEK